MPKINRITQRGRRDIINAPKFKTNYDADDFGGMLAKGLGTVAKGLVDIAAINARVEREADNELTSTSELKNQQAALAGSTSFKENTEAGGDPTFASRAITEYNKVVDERWDAVEKGYTNEKRKEKAFKAKENDKFLYAAGINAENFRKHNRFKVGINQGRVELAKQSMLEKKDGNLLFQFQALENIREATEIMMDGQPKELIEAAVGAKSREATEAVVKSYMAEGNYEKAEAYANDKGLYGLFAKNTPEQERLLKVIKDKKFVKHATDMADAEFTELEASGDFSPENIKKHKDFMDFVMTSSPSGFAEFNREFDSRVAQHFKAENAAIKKDNAERLQSIVGARNKQVADRIANDAHPSVRDGLLRRSEILYGDGANKERMVLKGSDRLLAMGVARKDLMDGKVTVDEIATRYALAQDDIDELGTFAQKANSEDVRLKTFAMINKFYSVRGEKEPNYAEQEELYELVIMSGDGKMPTKDTINNELALMKLNGSTTTRDGFEGRDLTYRQMLESGTDQERESWKPLLTDEEAQEMRDDPQYADIDFDPDDEVNPNDTEAAVYRERILAPLGISRAKMQQAKQIQNREQLYRIQKDLRQKEDARIIMSQQIADYKTANWVLERMQARQPNTPLRETAGVEAMLDEVAWFALEDNYFPNWMDDSLQAAPLDDKLPQNDMNGNRFKNAFDQFVAARSGNNPKNKEMDISGAVIRIANELLDSADDIPD